MTLGKTISEEFRYCPGLAYSQGVFVRGMNIEKEMKTIRGMKTAELLRMILSLIDQPAGLAEELARHGHVTTAAAQGVVDAPEHRLTGQQVNGS